MRTVSKALRFPLSGVVKKYPYTHSENGKYGSPRAVNVRGVGVFESRLRGGSRPPLVVVGSVTPIEADNAWAWPNGQPIFWTDEVLISFESFLPESETPAGEKLVRTDTLMNAVADKGAIPSGYTISAIYRDRLIIVKDNLWYMSRQGDYSDFDLGGDMDDVGRALAGSLALSGCNGEAITAVATTNDNHVFFATANTLWVLVGDPITGNLRRLSSKIGIVSPWAWSLHDYELAFLSNDGVYFASSESITRFSEERIPEALVNVDVSKSTVLMAYDVSSAGYHLFITPATGLGTHYWLDVENRAMWPVAMAADSQPTAVAMIVGSKLEEIAILGRDEVWRKFDSDAEKRTPKETDEVVSSSVSIGPFAIAVDMQDAMLAEIYASIAVGSSEVIAYVSTGHSAEDAVLAIDYPSFSFSIQSGWNRIVRPRARGAWCVITLESTGAWAFESLSLVAKQLGRLR